MSSARTFPLQPAVGPHTQTGASERLTCPAGSSYLALRLLELKTGAVSTFSSGLWHPKAQELSAEDQTRQTQGEERVQRSFLLFAVSQLYSHTFCSWSHKWVFFSPSFIKMNLTERQHPEKGQ